MVNLNCSKNLIQPISFFFLSDKNNIYKKKFAALLEFRVHFNLSGSGNEDGKGNWNRVEHFSSNASASVICVAES